MKKLKINYSISNYLSVMGSKGGKMRAENLTKKQLSMIGKKGVVAKRKLRRNKRLHKK